MPRSYPSAFRSTLIQGLYNARDDNIQVKMFRVFILNMFRTVCKDAFVQKIQTFLDAKVACQYILSVIQVS